MEQMRRVFLDNQLDTIIGPGYQTCAVPHDTYGFPVYTVLANVLDVRCSPFMTPFCELC